MADILIIYSTTDGHTRKICSRLKELIESDGDQVKLLSIDETDALDSYPADKVVLGASIRYGQHGDQVHRFIERQQAFLEARPNAFFSVNLVARKAHKRTPASNPYVRKFLSRIDWKPARVEVFAGRLVYRRYGFWDRNIIRLIMWITGGPTSPDVDVEYTDWEQVEAFARTIQRM